LAPVPEEIKAIAARRRAIGVAGHSGDEATARAGLVDAAPEVRASALSALARAGALRPAEVASALGDPDATVRRRACDIAGRLRAGVLAEQLVASLSDAAPSVVEAACFALGEVGEAGAAGGASNVGAGIAALSATATRHPEPLCREAAVAALGVLGRPEGLGAVLAALSDKPTIRRRAVVALAAFEGDEVGTALERAAKDRDWQVRQIAEDLLGRRPRPR
jgi:hypothetical protein